MSDFKKYIIGVVAFCVFCKCPLIFFIGAGITIVWWLISNVVLEQEVENKERHAICHVKRVQYSGELKIK